MDLGSNIPSSASLAVGRGDRGDSGTGGKPVKTKRQTGTGERAKHRREAEGGRRMQDIQLEDGRGGNGEDEHRKNNDE